MELIDLEWPQSWPTSISRFLKDHYDLFLGWETKQDDVSPQMFDKAVDSLRKVLRPYRLLGWHCTRLTDAEVKEIYRNGMWLPDREKLTRRIEAVVAEGLLSADVSRLLKSRNQADEKYRARMIWFCFYPPRRSGESGIERFFRHWGGEALYNSHERDPVSSPAIGRIGTPCLVEASVPIASFARHGGPELVIIWRFLADRGRKLCKATDFEGRIVAPLPADNVRRVIRFPDREFLELTGCLEWVRPIGEISEP